MDTISFLVAANEGEGQSERTREGTKSIFGTASADAIVERAFPVEKLRDNLTKATDGLIQVLADIRAVGRFKLTQVEVQVEISAEGGVDFIGTSKIGGKGAITLRFEG